MQNTHSILILFVLAQVARDSLQVQNIHSIFILFYFSTSSKEEIIHKCKIHILSYTLWFSKVQNKHSIFILFVLARVQNNNSILNFHTLWFSTSCKEIVYKCKIHISLFLIVSFSNQGIPNSKKS